MKDIIIVGTGAVAAELSNYIPSSGTHRIIGYIEYDYNIEKYYNRYKLKSPVLGDLDTFEPIQDVEYLIGISNIDFKKLVIKKLQDKNVTIGSFIHHTCIISETCKMGIGNIIYPQSIVGPNTIIGNYNLVTSYSFISHDCNIGNNNFMSTTGLSGNVNVGDDNFFGIRSTVIPNIRIGNKNTIQSGMVVNYNLNDNSTVFYKYKEQILTIKN